MAEYIRAMKCADLPEGEGAVMELGDQEIAIFRVNGCFFAMENTCPHQGGPLGRGFLEGTVVACPWHDWCFDVTTGQSVGMPGVAVRTYATRIRGNDLEVET